MHRILIFAMLPLALLAPTTATAECEAPTVDVTFGLVTEDGTYYVHVEDAIPELYEESNGVPNLQRGAPSPVVPDDADTCGYTGPEGPDSRML